MEEKDIGKLDFLLNKMIETDWLVTANDLHSNGYYDEYKDNTELIEKDFKYLLSVFSSMGVGEVSMTADAEMVKPNAKAIIFHKNGGFIKYYSDLKENDSKVEIESKKETERQDLRDEIDRLTKVNLELQNKQMRRYVVYSIIAFMLGAIITNVKDILDLWKTMTQE
ncbi:hypothetical protein [Xanthomarina gelatinilytica]|uniref:hypothetical protein n=1 Tax=Xanthomarina gelatinilytica TaxID=1137281 RepID=UPI003AA91EF5